MLQSLSDGAKSGLSKLVLVGLLFMAVAGLVLTDVGGFFRDGVGSTNVAEVGSKSISYTEFDRYVRRAVAQQGLTVENAYQFGLVNQILQNYAQEFLLAEQANDLGIRVPEEKVAEELHNFIKPYQVSGISPQEALDQFLSEQRISERDFVDRLKRTMTIELLQQSILSGSDIVPHQLINIQNRYANETRDMHVLLLKNNDINIEPPTDEDIQSFYEDAKEQYMIPARRQFQIAIFDPQEVADNVAVSDEEVETYYNTNIHLYEGSNRRDIAITIANTADAANEIMDKINNGSSLKAASPNTAYSRLEMATENDLVPVVASQVLDDNIDEDITYPHVLSPITTPLGTYIVELHGPLQTGPMPFDSVKSEIETSLLEDKRANMIFDQIDLIDEEIDDGVAFDEIVTSHNMDVLEIGPVDQVGIDANNNNATSDLGDSAQQVLQAAFYLREDELSSVEELADGRFAVIKVTQVTPQTYKPFEEVKTSVKERMVTMAQQRENSLRTQDYFNKMLDGELSLNDVAKETGATVKTLRNIKRDLNDQKLPEPLTPIIHQTLFNKEVGAPALLPLGSEIALAYSDNMQIPETVEMDDVDKAEAKDSAQSTLANLLIKTYLEEITEKKPIRINQRLIEQLYGSGAVTQ